MSPLKLIVLITCSLLLFNCSSTKGVPDIERYSGEYEFGYSNGQCNGKFKHFNGQIVDTILLYDKDGTIGFLGIYYDSAFTEGPGKISGTYRLIHKIKGKQLANMPYDLYKSMQSISQQAEQYAKSLYSNFPKSQNISGEIELEFWISPEGELKHLICLKDTTGQPDFITELISNLMEISIDEFDPSGYTVIRVPISLYS